MGNWVNFRLITTQKRLLILSALLWRSGGRSKPKVYRRTVHSVLLRSLAFDDAAWRQKGRGVMTATSGGQAMPPPTHNNLTPPPHTLAPSPATPTPPPLAIWKSPAVAIA
jgi:hypothetical protein